MGGGSAEKKLRPQRLPFTISSPLAVLLDNTTGVNDTKESKISAGLAGVEIAKNISNAIKKAVQSLSLIVNGTVLSSTNSHLMSLSLRDHVTQDKPTEMDFAVSDIRLYNDCIYSYVILLLVNLSFFFFSRRY